MVTDVETRLRHDLQQRVEAFQPVDRWDAMNERLTDRSSHRSWRRPALAIAAVVAVLALSLGTAVLLKPSANRDISGAGPATVIPFAPAAGDHGKPKSCATTSTSGTAVQAPTGQTKIELTTTDDSVACLHVGDRWFEATPLGGTLLQVSSTDVGLMLWGYLPANADRIEVRSGTRVAAAGDVPGSFLAELLGRESAIVLPLASIGAGQVAPLTSRRSRPARRWPGCSCASLAGSRPPPHGRTR